MTEALKSVSYDGYLSLEDSTERAAVEKPASNIAYLKGLT